MVQSSSCAFIFVISEVISQLSLAIFQMLAAVPVVSIPKPSTSFMFIVSRIFVYASWVSHSSREGVVEFHGVSGMVDPSFGWIVGILNIGIDPSRYPRTPRI